MKLVVQVKLLPTPEQAAALEATLRACNTAASDVAVVARQTGTYRNYDLRKHVYARIKDDYGLGAQAAQHVIKKVADAYTTVKANLQAGRYGKPGSKQRAKVETNPINFRSGCANGCRPRAPRRRGGCWLAAAAKKPGMPRTSTIASPRPS